MNYLPGIFSLLVAVCGWYYLFYSRAAMKLSAVENPVANRIRVTLRRAGGLTMLLLAATFYAGTVALEKQNAPSAAAFIFIAACLMFIVVALALIDLRMTNMLRKSQRNQKINPEGRE